MISATWIDWPVPVAIRSVRPVVTVGSCAATACVSPDVQCAAVRIRCGAMTVPPQVKPSWTPFSIHAALMWAIDGQLAVGAGLPAMICDSAAPAPAPAPAPAGGARPADATRRPARSLADERAIERVIVGLRVGCATACHHL